MVRRRIEGVELGAYACIDKPFSPEHLLVRIAHLLANRATIKQYFASTPMVDIKSMAYSKAEGCRTVAGKLL